MNAKALLLSICIPTFNRAGILPRALANLHESIESGPLRDHVEICLSDNASTDATSEVIRRFAADSRVPFRHVRQETNLGFSRNLDQAGRLAQGRYLLFFGDDDRLAPRAMRLLAEAIHSECPVTVFYSLPDLPLEGNPQPTDATAAAEMMSRGEEIVRRLGVCHLSFIGNFIVRRSSYFDCFREPFLDSLYPQMAALLCVLQQNPARVVRQPIFLLDDTAKTWNFPLLAAVDMARIFTECLPLSFASPKGRDLVYGRLVRSIPRAWLVCRTRKESPSKNPYQNLSLRNVLDCYRESFKFQCVAFVFWLCGRFLPLFFLRRILGNAPRIVHIAPPSFD